MNFAPLGTLILGFYLFCTAFTIWEIKHALLIDDDFDLEKGEH